MINGILFLHKQNNHTKFIRRKSFFDFHMNIDNFRREEEETCITIKLNEIMKLIYKVNIQHLLDD